MSNVDALLSRLNRVKQLPDGQWQASCPTALHKHGDRSAGLRIKVTEDGRILLHCFAGCTAEDITDALALSMSDLFPDSPNGKRPARINPRYLSRDAWLAVAVDATTCAIAFDDALQGREYSEEDAETIRQASTRLWQFAQRMAGGEV